MYHCQSQQFWLKPVVYFYINKCYCCLVNIKFMIKLVLIHWILKLFFSIIKFIVHTKKVCESSLLKCITIHKYLGTKDVKKNNNNNNTDGSFFFFFLKIVKFILENHCSILIEF